MKLLKKLCAIHAPSGQEDRMTDFLLEYIKKSKKNWKTIPQVFSGLDFQNAIVLVFGKPKTAVYAHIDSIGFTVRYGNELIKTGGPVSKTGIELIGEDSMGSVECRLIEDDKNKLSYEAHREIERGTMLTFKPNFREDNKYVQSSYLDNRLGVWNALRLAETLENGVIAFSCWEETGGGSAQNICRFLYENYKIRQALISDITWITPGIQHGKGVAISIRDSGIPRRSYINRIIEIAHKNNIPFQLEVESSGGSDGNVIQAAPYPVDWCFVGAPEDFVHSPDEKVHKKDIESMTKLYQVLMKEL